MTLDEVEAAVTRLEQAVRDASAMLAALRVPRHPPVKLARVVAPKVQCGTIMNVVADAFRVDVALMKQPDQRAEIVLPRRVAMYLTHRYTHLSTTAIGRLFGGRHHSTVLHSFRSVQRGIAENPALAESVRQIEQTLGMTVRRLAA